ncbi:MAG: hypothetical protein P4L51_07745, partial [Puia sp.]|nr:hypothetical protein [Puia sp.]
GNFLYRWDSSINRYRIKLSDLGLVCNSDPNMRDRLLKHAQSRPNLIDVRQVLALMPQQMHCVTVGTWDYMSPEMKALQDQRGTGALVDDILDSLKENDLYGAEMSLKKLGSMMHLSSDDLALDAYNGTIVQKALTFAEKDKAIENFNQAVLFFVNRKASLPYVPSFITEEESQLPFTPQPPDVEMLSSETETQSSESL